MSSGKENIISQYFEANIRGKGKFTRRMVIDMADYFGMRPGEMVWKLERMKLAKKGTWDWFKHNGGITQEHIKEVRAGRLADKS